MGTAYTLLRAYSESGSELEGQASSAIDALNLPFSLIIETIFGERITNAQDMISILFFVAGVSIILYFEEENTNKNNKPETSGSFFGASKVKADKEARNKKALARIISNLL